MPDERRAQFRVLNVPRSQISECTPFRIYKHAKCRVFERTCLQHVYVVPCSSKWGRPLCYGHAAARWCLQCGRGCRVHTCIMATGADFKMYVLCQFCSNWVKFFYNTQETQTQKMMDQNFEIRFLWFLRIFWNFQKGVAADLGHYGRGQTRSR